VEAGKLRQLAGYGLDGKRLRLGSSGSYVEAGAESLQLSWDVDLGLPVFERART
jgi:hypothetical protein